MDRAVAAAGTSRAYDFCDLSGPAVVGLVCLCVDDQRYADRHVVEKAAGVRPSLSSSPQRPSPTSERDVLDVSLHDSELADEVELTTRLIVAANEADRPLTQREVDEILDVRP